MGISGTLVAADQFPQCNSENPQRELRANIRLAQSSLSNGLVGLSMDFAKEALSSKSLADPRQINLARLILASAQIECGLFAEAEKTLNEIGAGSSAKTLRLAWAKIGQYQLSEAENIFKQIAFDELSPGDRPWYMLANGIFDKNNGNDEAAKIHFGNAGALGIDSTQRSQFEYIRAWADVTFAPELSEEDIEELREDMIRHKGTRNGAHYAKMLALSIYRKARAGDSETHRQARQVLNDARPLPQDLVPEFDFLEGLLQDSDTDENVRRAFMRVLRSPNAEKSLQEAALTGLLRHVNALALSGEKDAATNAANEIIPFLAGGGKNNSAGSVATASTPSLSGRPSTLAPARIQADLLDLGIFTRARIARLIGNQRELRSAVDELLEKCPKSPYIANALRMQIDEKRKAGEYRSAIPDLEKLRDTVSSPTEKAKANFILADCYFQSGDHRLAADAYSKINTSGELKKYSGEIFFQRLLSQLLAQDFDAAKKLIAEQKNAFANGSATFDRDWLFQAESALIENLRSAGELEEAQSECERFLEQSEIPDAYRIRVLWWDTLLAIELSDPDKAITNADEILRALKTHPQGVASIPVDIHTLQAGITSLRTRALLLKSDSKEELAAVRKEFKSLRERFPDSKAAAVSYLDEGRALANNNMNVEALSCFEELIRSCESKPEFSRYVEIAYFEAAQQELALGKPKDAVARFNTVGEKFKDSPLTFYATLRVGDLLREQNAFDDALEIYKKLTPSGSNHPEWPRVEISKADCLLAKASGVKQSDDSDRGAQESLKEACNSYEKLFYSSAASIELRAEAGYKWGEAWAKRADLLEDPTREEQDTIRREARKILWQVTETIFNQASRGGIDPSETWGVTSGYWLSRCFFKIGDLSEQIGDYEDARKAYTQIQNWSGRGWIPGSEYARSREDAIRDK